MSDQFNQHVIKMAAIGRQFQLGDLYDYQTDNMIKGDRYWESADMASATVVDTDFKLKLILPETESTKWEQMGLDEHLKASTVAGLIDKYRGATNFLKDQKKPAQMTRTVVCRIKSRKDQLKLETLVNQMVPKTDGRKEDKSTKSNEASHVVFEIVYGAEAYCILTQDLADETDQDAKDDAEVELNSLATKLESALEENKDISEFKELFGQEERKKLTRMKCRLYLDILTPTFRECNYFDAYKNCLKLIEQTKKVNAKSNGAVPIMVKLCPLNVIKKTTEETAQPLEYREVDAELVARCCRIWNQLELIGVKSDVARTSDLKLNLKNSLRDFKAQIDKYLEMARRSLRQGVIRARKIDGDDDAVEKIIQTIEEHSIFKPSRLERWLLYKSAEVEMTSKMTKLNGITFLATTSQLQKELSDSFDKKYSLVMQVPALDEKTNKILGLMKDYFESYTKLVACDDEDDEEDEDNIPWHMEERKRKQILGKIYEFSDHVTRNKSIEKQVQFFITLSEIGQKYGCRYSVYESDKLLSDINQLPCPPTDLQVYELPAKNLSSFRLEWNYEDLGYPHHFVVEYRLKDSSDSWNQQKTSKRGQRTITINYKQNSILELRVAVITCIGQSEFSDLIDTEYSIQEKQIEEPNESVLPQVHQHPRYSIASQNSTPNTSFQENINVSNMNSRPVLQPPIDLEVEFVTQTTAELGWLSPSNQNSGSKPKLTYRVRYCPNDQDLSSAKELDVGIETGCRLEQLKSETTYIVYVVAISADGQVSEPSAFISLTTLSKQVRFAEIILKRCKKNANRNGMDFYTVPLTKLNDSQVAKRFVLGKVDNNKFRHNGQAQHRTILVMGATGAGKTTLINGMINYIFGVEWEDKFRFQLIEEQVAGRSQIDSQTSMISAYDIHHTEGFSIPYSLTIVDTPGYGDTKGLDRDQEITEMIRKFFEDKNGIQQLDVVGFVAQASLPRLTPTQIYIFDSVLSIFGNDIKENINFLLTFADSQKPPILSAINKANLPCPVDPDTQLPLHHKFNNSGFFCSSRESSSGPVSTVEKFNRFFWRMGMENFQKFFLSLAVMNTKSLSLTKQVLDERKKLEATIDGLQPLIKVELTKMEELRKTEQMISNSQAQIDANQNVEFEVEVTVPVKKEIPNGQFLTNCNKCYITCHNPCAFKNDDDKIRCWAMDHSMPEATRSCRICPEKCIWNLHVNQPYSWEYVKEKQVTSSDVIKQKYESEVNKKLSAQELIALLQKDVDENDRAVLERVDIVAKCIQRLDEIALRPNPFSTPEYIDLIIDSEQQEKRTGFQERIESLKKLRKMAVIINKVRNKKSLFTLG